MAVSGASAVNKIPYSLGTDKPPDVPAVTKAMAEALDALKWGSRNLKPTVGVKAATESLALTGSYQDVVGTTLEITPAVASILNITAIFEFRLGEAAARFNGTIRLDSTDQTPVAAYEASGAGNRATVSQVYSLSLTAALHTVKMRAIRASGASGGVLGGEGSTRYLYTLVAS